MPPSRTGTASQINGGGGNGSTTVTVPSDCTCIVALWSHFDDNGGSILASLSLDGDDFSILAQIAENSDMSGVGCGVLVNPSIGEQTFTWNWSGGGARADGGQIVLVYLKDVNLASPIRDADLDRGVGGEGMSVTLDSHPTDIIIALASNFNNGTNPDLGGTVFISNANTNNELYDASQITPSGGSSTVVSNSVTYFATLAAVSVKEFVPLDLYSYIDEETFSDTDYIRSPDDPVEETCRFKIGTGGAPAVDTGHKIRWRIRKSGGGGNAILTIYQGGGDNLGAGTLIATRTRENPPSSFTTYEETLTEEEAGDITDYSDLYIEITGDVP